MYIYMYAYIYIYIYIYSLARLARDVLAGALNTLAWNNKTLPRFHFEYLTLNYITLTTLPLNTLPRFHFEYKP